MQFPTSIPFVEALGFELLALGDDRAVLAFVPRPEHHNSFGVVHGGACMTLLDVVMAHAARSQDITLGAVTVEMKSSFLRPAEGALRAEASVLHRSATLCFVEGRVLDAQGRLCAHATGTFKLVRRLPATGRALKDLQPPPESGDQARNEARNEARSEQRIEPRFDAPGSD